MTTKPLWIEHTYVIPASHPRGYRRCVRDPKTSRLQLSVKQYVCISRDSSSINIRTPNSSDEAITLVLHHGMPPAAFKEAFEPFLTELLSLPGIPPIRAIWTYDHVGFGASYTLNKDSLGDTHHWHDSARDLLQLVNHFASQMTPPIIGMGQSWGSVAIAMAAAWSPRLFSGMIFCEPLLENAHQLQNEKRAQGVTEAAIIASHAGRYMALRRTKWPNMSEVQSSLERNRLFTSYDPRVLSLIYKHEFYEHPDGSVELIPPSAQVVPIYMRPLPALPNIVPEREEHSILPEHLTLRGLGQNQGELTVQGLRAISCPVLFLWCTEPYISTSAYKARILANLGTGPGGGGGKSKGQVHEITVSGGHQLPFLQPRSTAEAVACWFTDSFWPAWSCEVNLVKKEPAVSPEVLSDEFLQRLRIASKL